MGAYAGTKAAIGAISSSLALELAPKKITVNTIHPGYTGTASGCCAAAAIRLASRVTHSVAPVAGYDLCSN